jgi:DNA-binding NarL/FixJ family response regulator
MEDGKAPAESHTNRVRVVLGQPYALVLEALGRLLEAAGLNIVARCDHAADLERCLRRHVPDVALVDTLLARDGDIVGLIRAARRGLNGGRLVLLVPEVTPALARDALALEIDGVLLKSARSDSVIAGLERVAAGDAVFPAGWLAAAHRAVEPHAGLSERQREVLELLGQGLPNATIAERLFISKNTVKFHVAAIYQRLGVSNRVQAMQALAELRAVEDLTHLSGWGLPRPEARGPARPREDQTTPGGWDEPPAQMFRANAGSP